jgi:hypothetical protein
MFSNNNEGWLLRYIQNKKIAKLAVLDKILGASLQKRN